MKYGNHTSILFHEVLDTKCGIDLILPSVVIFNDWLCCSIPFSGRQVIPNNVTAVHNLITVTSHKRWSVSIRQPLDGSFNAMPRIASKEISKILVYVFVWVIHRSPVDSLKMSGNAESVSMSRRHHMLRIVGASKVSGWYETSCRRWLEL